MKFICRTFKRFVLFLSLCLCGGGLVCSHVCAHKCTGACEGQKKMRVHDSLELKLQSIVTCHGSCGQTPIFCKNYKYSSLMSYLSSPNVFMILNNASQLELYLLPSIVIWTWDFLPSRLMCLYIWSPPVQECYGTFKWWKFVVGSGLLVPTSCFLTAEAMGTTMSGSNHRAFCSIMNFVPLNCKPK